MSFEGMRNKTSSVDYPLAFDIGISIFSLDSTHLAPLTQTINLHHHPWEILIFGLGHFSYNFGAKNKCPPQRWVGKNKWPPQNLRPLPIYSEQTCFWKGARW